MQKKFRYQLEALLRKRQLDQDVARNEEVAARAVLDAKRREVDEIRAAITGAEKRMREEMLQGAEIDRENRNVLGIYLTHQYDLLKTKQTELDYAVAVHDDIVRSVTAIHKDVKTLERHKDNRKAEYVVELQRTGQRLIDDLWLVRHGRNQSEPVTDE